MGYKEKVCPKCNSVHNKRGVYCSRSCGNQKSHKPETKKLIAKKQSEWMSSGDERAEAQLHSFTSLGNNKVAEPIAPIVPVDVGYRRYVEDGDLWEEVQLPETLPIETHLCGTMWEVYVAHVCGRMCMGSRVGVHALSRVYGCNIAILI